MTSIPKTCGETIRVRDFVGTEIGVALLQEDPVVTQLVARFARNGDRPEPNAVEELSRLGAGDSSIAYSIGNTALKISDSKSSRRWAVDRLPCKPENLISHYRYLSTLGDWLGANSEHITVPMQYFAVKTERGSFMQAYKYMDGWRSLSSWVIASGMEAEERAEFYDRFEARIKHEIPNRTLQSGLKRDLFSQPNRGPFDRRSIFHASNVLIPDVAINPVEADVCIIDQSGGRLTDRLGLMGRLKLSQALAHAS